MVLPRTRLWRGTDAIRRRQRAVDEVSRVLAWPTEYLFRFLKLYGDSRVMHNCAHGWVVVTDYSGIGTPEFALRCLEDRGGGAAEQPGVRHDSCRWALLYRRVSDYKQARGPRRPGPVGGYFLNDVFNSA